MPTTRRVKEGRAKNGDWHPICLNQADSAIGDRANRCLYPAFRVTAYKPLIFTPLRASPVVNRIPARTPAPAQSGPHRGKPQWREDKRFTAVTRKAGYRHRFALSLMAKSGWLTQIGCQSPFFARPSFTRRVVGNARREALQLPGGRGGGAGGPGCLADALECFAFLWEFLGGEV